MYRQTERLDEFNGHPAERGTLQNYRDGPYDYGLCFVLYIVEFIEIYRHVWNYIGVNRGNLRDAKIPEYELNSFR